MYEWEKPSQLTNERNRVMILPVHIMFMLCSKFATFKWPLVLRSALLRVRIVILRSMFRWRQIDILITTHACQHVLTK